VKLADLARRSLDSMSNNDIAALWSLVPRLLHKRSGQDPKVKENFMSVIDATVKKLDSFWSRDLATTSLGIAKTVKQVSRGDRYREDDPRQILRDLLVKESQYLPIFDSITSSAVGMLYSFDARCLSNLIYSCGLVEYKYNPDIRGKTLFNIFAQAAAKKLHTFNPQDISNMLLAFVYVDAKNSRLFQETGKVISEMYLREFTEQELANVLWTFAKSYEADPDIFQAIGNHIVGRSLDDFWPQALSNIVWAYATAEESHPELFKKIGDHVAGLGSLDSFDPQALSNTAWAFATAGVLHTKLFKKIGDHIAGLDSLDSFKPQELSNTAWAFATAGVPHPDLFEKIGNHIAGLSSLDLFNSQALSNTAWAFATAGVLHPKLFKQIGDHVAGLGSLDSFDPQELSNTAWAFASAGVSHPELFKKIGDHVAGLGNLDSFNAQALSSTAWAYATAKWFDRRLFEKLVTEATVTKDCFNEQEVANFLWACSTVSYTDERLFSTFAPVIASKLDECNGQEFANIAWAYSVANVPSQDLFNQGFIGACASNEEAFSDEGLAQLHQWQLWQQELESGIKLPQSLQERCHNAFISQGYSKSKLQGDVMDELKAAGLDLDEKMLLGSGYRIDALVKVGDGRRVAVEVDGPYHFIQRLHTGSTTLKHRQVTMLDCIEVVSVPHWEWRELKNSEMKQRYLHKKLG